MQSSAGPQQNLLLENSFSKCLVILSAASLLSGFPTGVAAADGIEDIGRPRAEVNIDLETGADYTFLSGDPGAKVSDTYPTVNMGISLHANQYLSLHGGVVLEPTTDVAPHSHRFFKHNGIYLEELYMQIAFEPARFFAGKINPSFGTAWEATPGVHGGDFAEGYQLVEQIGLGGETTFQRKEFGTFTLSGAAFYTDTSHFSDSAWTKRGITSLKDGGAGNTEKLNNYALTLDGNELPAMPGIGFHLGYRFRNKGKLDTNMYDESGMVAGMTGAFDAGDRHLDWIAEIAGIQHIDGTTDNAYWLTIGASVSQGPYNITASYTGRRFDSQGGGKIDDTLLAVSAGREIGRGWSAALGYKYENISKIDHHTAGLRLSKSFAFKTGK